MSNTKRDSMRVIIFQQADVWVGQCVEHDISAQGSDFEQMMRRLVATVNAESAYTREKHGDEFATIDPAPAMFAELFDAGECHLQTETMELRIAA